MTKLFSSPTPTVATAATAPTALPDDKAIARTARRTTAERRTTQGRQSTLLTSGGRETLGAG